MPYAKPITVKPGSFAVLSDLGGPDARHFAKPVRLGLDDFEHLLPEGLDHLLGVDRPDAPDHPGAEIFLDPVD